MFGNVPPFFPLIPTPFCQDESRVCLPRLLSGNHLAPGVQREGAPLKAAFGRRRAELAVLSPRVQAHGWLCRPLGLGPVPSPWPWPSPLPAVLCPVSSPGRSTGTLPGGPGSWGRHPPPVPPAPHILEPRFLLLNFSQVKYSIGLLESKVLRLTD